MITLNFIFEFLSSLFYVRQQQAVLPAYLLGNLEAVKRFSGRSRSAVLLVAIFITPCLADARPKVVSSWAFPGKSTKRKTVKHKPAKRPFNTNYAVKTPGVLLATQNLQAQQAAQRGLEQQLRQTQSSGQSANQ